jgi:hypothetical protein
MKLSPRVGVGQGAVMDWARILAYVTGTVDLPAVRRAPPAEQEGQGDRPADLESFTRPDVDVAGLPAGIRRVGGVALDDRRATKWSGGEGSVSKLFVGRFDLDLVPATSAADFDLEIEGRDFAEGGEGQWVKHPPTVARRRRTSLPAVLIPAAAAPLPVVACSNFVGMAGLRQMSASIPKDQPPGVLSGDYVDLMVEEFQEAYATLDAVARLQPVPATGRQQTGNFDRLI